MATIPTRSLRLLALVTLVCASCTSAHEAVDPSELQASQQVTASLASSETIAAMWDAMAAENTPAGQCQAICMGPDAID